jgi:ribosome-associated translation inhibitor RaiA
MHFCPVFSRGLSVPSGKKRKPLVTSRDDMTKTTIAVSQEVIEALKREGNMHESYDDVLNRLLEELRQLRAKGK